MRGASDAGYGGQQVRAILPGRGWSRHRQSRRQALRAIPHGADPRFFLIRAQATAKSNVRDIIEPFDLPITKGLRQCMYDFEKIDKELGLMPILDQLVARPPLDMGYSVETETQFAPIAGGLSVALARTFTIIDPKVKNPQS